MPPILMNRRTAAGLLLAAAFSPASPALAAVAPIPVVLDTDIGDDIDDALALSLAIQSPELKVLAVTTVLQEGDLRAALVWKILKLYGRTDIPVGVGAEQTLLGKPRTQTVVQTAALGPADKLPPGKRHIGIELFIDTCLHHPGKVTVIAIGPLTNIAIALRAEPRIEDHIDRIMLMNGVFFHTGVEYNTSTDSEASEIVYSCGLPITAVGLDVTMQCRLNADQMKRIESSSLPTAKFLLDLIRLWQRGNPTQYPILHDPLAVGVTVKPSLVSLATGDVTVETRGTPGETNGASIFRKNPSGNVRVAEDVNSAAVIDLFLDRILAAPRGE